MTVSLTLEPAEEIQAGDEARPDYIPDSYDSVEDFLAEARKVYRFDREFDHDNLEAALDDLRFASGDQWDTAVKADRDALQQPSVTNNTLPQFIGQVVGDRRANQTSIKVLAREESDTDIAEIRSDLIRNIETQSRASRVYAQAFEHMVTCGIGNFRVELDWTDDDVFDRDIFIRPIANPLSVTWDAMSIDPTGRDAEHCFVDDVMPRKLYEELYPDQPVGDFGENLVTDNWVSNDTVKVTEYWRMVTRKRVIALMTDGKVIDITDKQWDEFSDQLFRDETGQPRIREVDCKYAQMHLVTGFAILKPAYELKINRLPIVRCNGREIPVGDKRCRFGLIRFVKDNQRLANFWDSVKAEILSKAPRQQWIGPADAFEGYESSFRNAHITGDPILKTNPRGSGPIVPVQPIQYPTAFATESAVNKQAMRDGTGIHEANLGMKSNETSGRAIMARQHEGDVATIIYHDNQNAAEQEAGDVINQLIPQVYDVARTIRVVGPEQEERLVRINDPMRKDSVDLSRGKYDVTISTGPAFQTKMLEAQASMTEFMRAVPEAGAMMADKVPKAMGWPGADEISERFRKHMIKQGLIEDDNDEMGGEGQEADPAQAAAMQQQQQAMQMQQMAAQAQQITMQAEVAKAQAEARQAEANAMKAEADAQKAQIEARRAEAEMHAGIARNLDELSGAGMTDPTNNLQPVNDSRGRHARPRKPRK